jgi:hypothetical protein
MMTRQELVIEFMKALASNPAMISNLPSDKVTTRDIFLLACELTDKVLEVS